MNANDSSRQNGLAKTRLQPSATTVDLAAVIASMEEFGQISMCTLIGIVVVYLVSEPLLLVELFHVTTDCVFFLSNGAPRKVTREMFDLDLVEGFF